MKYVESIDWMGISKPGLLVVIYKPEVMLELDKENRGVVVTCI